MTRGALKTQRPSLVELLRAARARRQEALHSDEMRLSHPITVRGVVVAGDRRGRELGFPTANLVLTDPGASPEGVFAGTVVRQDGRSFAAAVSVGRRPTFYGAEAAYLLEAHLLDFVGDLYGEELTVVLSRYLRGQQRYDSIEGLVDQIVRDVADVRVFAQQAGAGIGKLDDRIRSSAC